MRDRRFLPIRVLRDETANVLPLAAMGLLIGAAIVGSAIDIGRNFKVKQQIQAACDAGVLAGRRTVTTDGFDDASRTAAENYFRTNFNANALDTRDENFEVDSPDGGKTVEGIATATIDSLVMRIFGYSQFDVRVTCASSMGVGNADVMMVLDTTGSMQNSLDGSTRIAALRAAMLAFYDTLINATANTNARIRYGFVPYSSSVNVGRLLEQDHIANGAFYQSREPIKEMDGYKTSAASTDTVVTYSAEILNGPSKGSTKYSSLSACNNKKTADSADFANQGGSSTQDVETKYVNNQKVVVSVTTQPQRKYTYTCQGSGSAYYIYTSYLARNKLTTVTRSYDENWVFKRWEYKQRWLETDRYKTFQATTVTNGSNGSNQSYTWGGCIHERRTEPSDAFVYVPAEERIEPEEALDVDLDTPPENTDEGTKWAPMWPQMTYRRSDSYGNKTLATTTSGTAMTNSSYCPVAAQQLQEMDADAFETYAKSLSADGSTYLDIGMIWGGRMLSRQGLFADNVNEEPDNGGEVSRHIIFMTDGVMEPNDEINQAWGTEWWDRKVTDSGTLTDSTRSAQDVARHNQRFLAVCQAIKAKGIRVWVIAFTSSLSTNLRTCASDNSSFPARNASELSTAFQEIAKQVGELRITQ